MVTSGQCGRFSFATNNKQRTTNKPQNPLLDARPPSHYSTASTLSHAIHLSGDPSMLRARNLALAIAVCLTLHGCGGSNKQSFKYKIAVIPKGLTHEFWQSVHRGAEQAAKDLTDKGI